MTCEHIPIKDGGITRCIKCYSFILPEIEPMPRKREIIVGFVALIIGIYALWNIGMWLGEMIGRSKVSSVIYLEEKEYRKLII